MPQEILGNEQAMREWIRKNDGTIVAKENCPNITYIYIGGVCKGWITIYYKSANFVDIKWTVNNARS